MNRLKICSALLALATIVLCAPASNGQAIPIVGVGSSASFPITAVAATVGDPIRGVTTPLCGARFWTGTASAIDARSSLTTPSIPAESGSAWVAWDNDTTPTTICAYLSVDSIVGQRLFFGQGPSGAGNATLSIPTSACTTAGANKVSYVWDTATAGLPVAVWNALTGGNSTASNCSGSTTTNPVHFNVAFTDIRPEDAQFVGLNRVLCNDANSTSFYPPDDKSCLGYGPGISAPGTAVLSSFSTASAQAVDYVYTGTDPISNVAVPASQVFVIGAEAVIPIVNTVDTSSAASFGTLTALSANPRLTNVSSHTLAAVYSGQAILTRDVLGLASAGLPAEAVHALQREPMSGTYTTFEFQVIRQRDALNALSQETGVCGPSQGTSCTGQATGSNTFSPSATAFPTVTGANPLSACAAGACGLRTRVIGTGQMVSVANTASFTSQSILGYAFWSIGSFGGKTNIKYLTLDGTDGLFPSYSTNNGNFPGQPTGQGTSPTPSAPSTGQCGGYFNGGGSTGITAFSCNGYTLPTFDGIQSGNYRAWSLLRGQYYGSSVQSPSFSPLNITGFIQSAQDQAAPTLPAANRVPDILPVSYCANASCSSLVHPVQVFRSHYALPAWNEGFPQNGVVAGQAEVGGDVAGSVFNTQIELDLNSIFSSSFLSYLQ
ncbi:MAG: hypothetical protein ABSG69_01205 [Candidatus Acidiferrum sp.]